MNKLYYWYTKPNRISLVAFISFWLFAITGFLIAMDFFKEPNYIGIVLIFASVVEIIRLIKNYRKGLDL